MTKPPPCPIGANHAVHAHPLGSRIDCPECAQSMRAMAACIQKPKKEPA